MGRGQAVFFVDNRRIYDLSELDRLSSVDIESIEVVANPGSEYDASVKAVVRVATYANFARGLSVDARSTWYQNRNASVVEQLGLRYSAQRWTAYNNLDLSTHIIPGPLAASRPMPTSTTFTVRPRQTMNMMRPAGPAAVARLRLSAVSTTG